MHDTIPRDLTQLFGSSVKVRGRALEAAGEIRITSCLNGVASGRVPRRGSNHRPRTM